MRFYYYYQIIYSFKHAYNGVTGLQLYLTRASWISLNVLLILILWENLLPFIWNLYICSLLSTCSFNANKTIGITHLFPLLEHLLYILLMSYLEALICLFILCLVISGILFSSNRIVVGYPFSSVLQLKTLSL